ncbi:hypothetical protein RF11_05884 [Thelohanellus kitauei]|uniref:Uncharacterized protein n=1 Tax=Thelohanellus kitauei TaxID=669202 RepID=A0A0C2M119_THEKT|nr:hypothetical protein RF11_05884 [Thelohanellus kitauei]
MGVELQQAIKVDAILNDDTALNLEDCSKIELVEMIHALRCKLLDSMKNVESYDSLLREDMCQFTMDMMAEIEEENEHRVQLQTQLVAESYLVKIEILKEEIDALHEKYKHLEQQTSNQQNNEVEILKAELHAKDKNLNQLLSDVDTFKNDSRREVLELQDKLKHLNSLLAQKDSETKNLETNINQLNVCILSFIRLKYQIKVLRS